MSKTKSKSTKRASTNQMVRAPVAQNKSSKSKRQIVETHRECERVATVPGSVAFSSVLNIPVNPGIRSSFPWLAGLGELYERYAFDEFIVRYKNLKGTGSDGNIILSFDYDTLDAGPTTAVEQTQSTVWIDGAPWRIFEMKVPVDAVKRFIRTGPVAGADLKTYDFGRVWVSAEGCANTSDHGYLEFEYSVKLFEKQPAGASAAPVNQTVSLWNMSNSQASGGASILLDIDEAVALPAFAAPSNVNGLVTLPLGNFLVTGEFAFSGGTTNMGTVSIFQDGIAMPIPADTNLPCDSAFVGSGSVTTYVRSTGATTVSLNFVRAAGSPTFVADRCRLIVQSV